ncbi:hypothetical protein SLS62_004061 [Diatrype stigma]|uniref:Uncharacterized protein n=1 Tax=Diatrype stigma TaxID=117547 RepID=A0AAN9YTG5_9PEZI
MVRRAPRPTLIHMLSDDGFEWRSFHGNKPLLKADVSRKIAHALKSFMPAYTTEQTARAIALMFNAATQHVHGPLTITPQEFWGEIKPQVTWLRDLDTETILLFSWSALSARHVASEMHVARVEMEGHDPEDYPMPDSAASKAVSDYSVKLRDTQSFAVRYAFMPGWIHDRHNQGDKESTQAAFMREFENSQLYLKAKREAEMEGGKEEAKYDKVKWYGVGTTHKTEEDEEEEEEEDLEMGEAEDEDEVMVDTVEEPATEGHAFQLPFRSVPGPPQ